MLRNSHSLLITQLAKISLKKAGIALYKSISNNIFVPNINLEVSKYLEFFQPIYA